MVIMDLLNYIKDLFSHRLISSKRRAPDDCGSQHSSKYRKLSNSKMSAHGGPECINLLDDLVSNASSSSARNKHRFHHSSPDARYKGLGLRDITTINLDDEDNDVIIMTAKESLNHSRRSGKFTSTPNYSMNRSHQKDDDVTFLKVIEPSPEHRLYAKRRQTTFNNKHSSPLYTNGSTHNGTTPSIPRNNNHHDIISPIYALGHTKEKATKSPAYRLDEKKIYRKLLMNSAPSISDAFYDLTLDPLSSLGYGSLSRGKKLVAMSNNRSFDRKKTVDVIDLTQPLVKPKKPAKLSTRDTIRNVISKFDNEVINLNSDSSDVEVLPTPPSPKRDFQINRVNSLKTYADPSEPFHEDWINNLLINHKEIVAKREKEIQEQKAQSQKLRLINTEIRTKRLEHEILNCLKIRDTLLPVELPEESVPLPKLTEEQERRINYALDKYGDDSEILARKFNMNIARRDIRTLSGLNWLNDEVINFYMNLIIERGKQDKWPSVYAMNTFFYPKLLKDGHSSIRRWTRKVDVFAHDMIVVPIHLRMHWCMAIINLQNKTITYFDSMGSSNKLCLESLMKYLQEEHLDKKKCEFDTKDWKLINAEDIPQQMNGSDCGMFSCTFAEFLSRNAKITFSQEDMPYLRRKMVIEILEGRLLIS